MRVLDAHVYSGCFHLLPLRVDHQLTLAGIEGATLVADPETLDFLCGHVGTAEVADRWKHPRYLTRRGNFHTQKYPYPWLPSIPVTAPPYGRVTRGCRAFACDDPGLPGAPVRRADGREHLTQCQCQCSCLDSYLGRVRGVHRRVFTRLLSIPTPRRKASRQASNREVSGVSGLGSRRVVPTGRLTVQGAVWPACYPQAAPGYAGGSPLEGKEPNCCNRAR
jgi:hypothetical protein